VDATTEQREKVSGIFKGAFNDLTALGSAYPVMAEQKRGNWVIVASTLMSMGMIMLPPVFISLPFKILLFVLVDGWNLVTRSLVESFHV